MRVREVRIVEVRGRMAAGAANANTHWTERSGLWVGLRDEDGRWGQGEASPLPGYCQDDLPQARRAILMWESSGLPVLELGRDPLAAIALALRQVSNDSPAARFALEAALFDLASQRLHTSVATLLGARSSAVAVAQVLAAADGCEAIARASRLAATGTRAFKVKVGTPGRWGDELAFVESLRRAVGPAVRVRLDANRALGGPELALRLAALQAVQPEFVEEPALPGQVAALAELPVRLALDESLQDPPIVDRLSWWLGCYQVVVLKPMALGGLLRCRALASIARAHRASVVVTHTLDGPIGWSAAAALALAVHDDAVAAGLAPHPGLTTWPAVKLMGLSGGSIADTGRPGWGFGLLVTP